jgi:hypothetical protein
MSIVTAKLTVKDKNLIFLSIAGIMFLNILPVPILSPILILLFGAMLGISIIFIFVHDDFNFLLKLFLIGFAIRVFLSFFFYILSFVFKGNYSPGFLFSDDGWGYSVQGWEIYKFAERGIKITRRDFLINPNFQSLSGNLTVYDYFTSFIYSITGHSPVSLFFISSIAGSLTAIFIYLIARELFSKNVARLSALFAFFWPSFIIWSTQNIKEPMVALFACILVWTIFYMHSHPFPGFLLLSIPSIWVLFKIGFPYLVMIISMILLSGLFLFLKHLFKHKFASIIIIGLLLFTIIAFFKDSILSLVFKKSLYDVENYKSIFDFLDYHRSLRAFGRLSFLKGADISTLGKAFVFTPLGLLYAIFAPFPWQLGSITQILAAPETIVFYILIPFTIKGIVFAHRKRFNQSIMLLFIIVAILFFLALVEGNSGTLFRHRFTAFNFLFIFTAVGLSLRKKNLGNLAS